MTKRRGEPKSNIKFAYLFFAFIFSIITISFLIKGIMIVKESIYGSFERFNLKVSNLENDEIISFSQKLHAITVLKIKGGSKNTDLSQLVGIPIDGFLKDSDLDLNSKPSSIISQSIFKRKNFKTNLTILDTLRLLLFTISVNENSIKEQSVSPWLSNFEIDKLLSRLFKDEYVERETDTIEIVNGADVLGLGNRLARLISNMGGDVVVVQTADKAQSQSQISYVKKDYTVQRLGKFLGFRMI